MKFQALNDVICKKSCYEKYGQTLFILFIKLIIYVMFPARSLDQALEIYTVLNALLEIFCKLVVCEFNGDYNCSLTKKQLNS